jgi:hypothetical protein
MSRYARFAIPTLVATQILAGCPRPGLTSPPASLLAYITQFNTDEIAVVDSVLKNPVGTIKVGSGPVRMALKPTGSQEYLYVLNQTGSTVSFVNRRSGSTQEDVAAGSRPDDIAISPDGKWLFVTSPEAATLTRINVTSRIADQTFRFGSGFKPRGVAVNPVCQKSGADCASLTVYVVNELVSSQTAGGNTTKIGQVRIMTSQASGLVDGPTVQLNGAERPWHTAIDKAGKNLFVTDPDLGSGMWRVDLGAGSNVGVLFGSSPVGRTLETVVADDGTLYATIPTTNQYVQVKPEGSALLYPDATKIRDTQPEPIAFNSEQSELWIGFVGTSTVAYASIQSGRPFDLRAVTFSLSSQTKQPPKHIILAGGAGG